MGPGYAVYFGLSFFVRAPSTPPSVLAAAVSPGALARDEAPGFDEGSAPGFDKGPQFGQQPAMTPRERRLILSAR